MACFFRHFAADPPLDAKIEAEAPPQKPAQRNLLDAVCEEYASLSGAKLGIANVPTNFAGTDLVGANLSGADLTGATWLSTKCPNGTVQSTACS